MTQSSNTSYQVDKEGGERRGSEEDVYILTIYKGT